VLLEVRWDTRGSKETAAGRKCKTEAGPTPPQSKKKRKAPAGEKLLAKLRGTTSLG